MGDSYADKQNVKDPLQLATEASWDGLADALRARYAGLSDRLVMYLGGPAWDRENRPYEASPGAA